MPFDGIPEDFLPGPRCPRCAQPIGENEPTVLMHFQSDAAGSSGISMRYHAECARPYWDTISPVLARLPPFGG
jgi:hypothetical protein